MTYELGYVTSYVYSINDVAAMELGHRIQEAEEIVRKI